MVTIKIFDCKGVKTVDLLGNANEQDYDPVPEYTVDIDSDSELDTSEE